MIYQMDSSIHSLYNCVAGPLFKKWIALLFEEPRPEVHFKPKETGFSALK